MSDFHPPASFDFRRLPRLFLGRGPFHIISLLISTLVCVSMPILYIAAVEAAGIFLGYGFFYTIKELAMSQGLEAVEPAVRMCGLLLGGGFWVVMLRPLVPPPQRRLAAMQVTAATQPDLFDLLGILCSMLRTPLPREVWLDCGTHMRSRLHGSIGGAFRNETSLTIGLPLIGVLKARELAAVLAMELGMSAGGLGVTLSHAVREIHAWMHRALYHRDPWEREIAPPVDDEEGVLMRMLRVGWGTFVWVGLRPFWLVTMFTRGVAQITLLGMEANARECAVRLIGHEATGRVRQKLRQLEKAWALSEKSIASGRAQSRLPENVTLLTARHFSTVTSLEAPYQTRWRTGASRRPPAADLIEFIGAGTDAAVLLHDFLDLSRQMSWFYYQQELGIEVHTQRMVAAEESVHQARRECESLAVIRRYFGGLGHPERAVCGLGATHAGTPGIGVLKSEIITERRWAKQAAHQMRATLREWNLAWQRRRDLEAACALSLAGYSVSRLQFGMITSTPAEFLKEALEQKTLMDHLDEPLRHAEVHLEKRLTSALGLLWWLQPDSLPDRLAEMREQLPARASLYESLGSVLPSFRELLTAFHTFQTLGAKFAGSPATGSQITVLQSIVPMMNQRAAQILAALDGAANPFATGQQTQASLAAHLAPEWLQETPPANAATLGAGSPGLQEVAQKMCRDTATRIAPFVDRYLALYHQSYAWLAEAAERTERHVFGAADVDAPTEEDEEIASILESLEAQKPAMRYDSARRELAVA
jgi:hypothetical protein